jgi:hypothetical protein
MTLLHPPKIANRPGHSFAGRSGLGTKDNAETGLGARIGNAPDQLLVEKRRLRARFPFRAKKRMEDDP